ncbi:ECF-type riboflavin transporter substrate-binding protein [Clostridium aminobutyricum]|uniref:ECF-type riboflavin transporter substrate-binding protein n=1 Tax=Clostridium aminobutyricum TaxID=33953 RepID=A0A939IJZ0_CLOAM|nr:ECF-type riboflavin transporter substrate-binding protein [Clostridium aminobutyricum]MBN7774088.1 ECF-type riboflavin transporter substrate-binding protein [Clostridium aminobutyricum]
MEGIKGFFTSIITLQGLIAVGIAVVLCIIIFLISKKRGKSMSTKTVVAVGIGAALYAALSAVAIPIGPNTSFRIAIVLLPIFGAFFGPAAGFLIGFIGHALNDAFMYGSVWWSWVFMSAMLGFFGGFVRMDKRFDPLNGVCTKLNILSLYIWSAVGMFVGSMMAYFGDVHLYGEPAEKLFIQITLANISNLVVVFVIGVPAIAIIAKSRTKNSGLTKGK